MAERDLISAAAAGARVAVEIGVAEGASAATLRQALPPNADLFLVDPYAPGKLGLSFARLTARRHVKSTNRGGATVHWCRALSQDLGREWQRPIDFLFIDGDHSYQAVQEDWRLWSPHLTETGRVAFHDARVFPNGWVTENDGPVRLVRQLLDEGWTLAGTADSVVVLQRC